MIVRIGSLLTAMLEVFPDIFDGRNGPELTQRQHRFFSRFGFFTCGIGKVLRAKTDADFFQEGCRWFASGKYPNIVVGEHLRLACHIEHHGILPEFHVVGVEEHTEFPLARGFLDTLSIAFRSALKDLVFEEETRTPLFETAPWTNEPKRQKSGCN